MGSQTLAGVCWLDAVWGRAFVDGNDLVGSTRPLDRVENVAIQVDCLLEPGVPLENDRDGDEDCDGDGHDGDGNGDGDRDGDGYGDGNGDGDGDGDRDGYGYGDVIVPKGMPIVVGRFGSTRIRSIPEA